METIESFRVDHNKLKPGLYVSRNDSYFNLHVTTLDLRFTRPNVDPPLEQSALHTIEHLGAVYFRNKIVDPSKIVYFGPMGCRTGFYLLVFGDYRTINSELINMVKGMCNYILEYEGDIPGATPGECGNYMEHNLALAKQYVLSYLGGMICAPSFKYPD